MLREPGGHCEGEAGEQGQPGKGTGRAEELDLEAGEGVGVGEKQAGEGCKGQTRAGGTAE